MSLFNIDGLLSQLPDPDTVVTYAAASPADRNGSFSGSGFPFASEEQAFDTTPNKGTLQVRPDGSYSVQILYPNSYYRRLGSDLVPPTLYIAYQKGGQTTTVSTPLGPSIPFRTLTYPAQRQDVSFYNRGSHDVLNPDRDARSQECILRESGYPCIEMAQPVDFWGLVTPR